MLLYFQYLVLMCVCPVACLFAHGKIRLRTRKSSAFLLSRFIFLTYLLGIIHILHTLIYIHIQIYRCCSVFRDGVAAVDAGVRLPYSSHKHTYKHTHTHQWNAHRSFVWKVDCSYCYFLLAISRRSLMSWFINHPQFHYLQIIFNRIRRHICTYMYDDSRLYVYR